MMSWTAACSAALLALSSFLSPSDGLEEASKAADARSAAWLRCRAIASRCARLREIPVDGRIPEATAKFGRGAASAASRRAAGA